MKRIKLRTLLIGGFISLFFLVLVGRMFFIQIVQGEYWQKQAAELWSHTSIIKAERGEIVDRNGIVLASDVPTSTVVVMPDVIHEHGLTDEVIDGLHTILGKDKESLRKIVEYKDKETGKYAKNREVRNEGWKIDEELAQKVRDFREELKDKHGVQEPGVDLVREQKRYYPKDELAAHILGYTDRDGKAVAGLEAYYDKQLKGSDGSLNYKSDGKGTKLPDAEETFKPVVNGSKFRLTIDSTIQYYIENAMKEAFAKYQPKSMTVIAADPKTMDILGMANLPTFNPNEFWKTTDYGNFYNHAIKSIYEPGSTFKIVTLAGTVQEKLFNPNAFFKSGSIRVKGSSRVLRDINHSGWGEISYLEGVKRSSNVAFVKLGFEMLGKEKLVDYITNFGFKEKTGIDLPGEVSGRITPQYDVEYATLAYGHGKVQVTPIEQLAAVAAIANGGKLMKPHLVKEITNPNTGDKTLIQPEVVREVISESAARETGSYLEAVVSDQEKGTGRHAYIEGYRVAGKTGTAIKYSQSLRDYDRSKVLASFIGYAPVNDPKIAMIVIIDEPKDSDGGGKAAAPVFQKIVSQALPYMGVPKVTETKGKDKASDPAAGTAATAALRSAPDLTGKSVEAAREQLLKDGYDFEAVGTGADVVSQYPAAGTKLAPGQRIFLLSEQSDKMKLPDLKGESLRDALEILSLMKIGIRIEGEGYVESQTEDTKDGQRTVTLKLKPVNSYGEQIPVTPDPEEGEEEAEVPPG